MGKNNIPKTGPIIVAASARFVFGCQLTSDHPNMVLDSLVVACNMNGRMDGHFWAKAPLFKGVFGWILRQAGAVWKLDSGSPVHEQVSVLRRQDLMGNFSEDDRLKFLDTMFEDSYKVLDIGHYLLIFPEGTRYDLLSVVE